MYAKSTWIMAENGCMMHEKVFFNIMRRYERMKIYIYIYIFYINECM